MNTINKPKYYESQLTFKNGYVYSKGELYGYETDFWDDVENGRIVFCEDVQSGISDNLPDSEEMTRATE